MHDFSDQKLDDLLGTLSTPQPRAGLTARILSSLPNPPATWQTRLASILGTKGLTLPASGALASLIFGIITGYWIAPTKSITNNETVTLEDDIDTLIADMLGTHLWEEINLESSLK